MLEILNIRCLMLSGRCRMRVGDVVRQMVALEALSGGTVNMHKIKGQVASDMH